MDLISVAIADTLPYYDEEDQEDDDEDTYRRRKKKVLKSQIKGHPCSLKSNGLILDPEDCSSYYLCSNGIPYHMNCPAGTVWNQKLRGCAFMFDPSFPCEMVNKKKSYKTSSKKHMDPYAKYFKEESEEDDFRYEPYLSELERKYLKQKAEEYAKQVKYLKQSREEKERGKKVGQALKLQSDGTYEKVFSINKGKSVLKESAYNVAGV